MLEMLLLLLQDELLKKKLIEFMDEVLERAKNEGLTGNLEIVLNLKEREGKAFKDGLFLVGLKKGGEDA